MLSTNAAIFIKSLRLKKACRRDMSRKLISSKGSISNEGSARDCSNLLSGVRAYFLEKGLSKKRTDILTKQLERHGGVRDLLFSDEISHVVVDKEIKLPKLCDALKVSTLPSGIAVVSADWLTACFKDGKVTSIDAFLIEGPVAVTTKESPIDCTILANKDDMSESKDNTKERQESPSIQKESERLQPTTSRLPETSSIKSPFNKKRERKIPFQASDSSYENSENVSDEDDVSEINQKKRQRQDIPESLEGPKGNWVCTKPSSSKGTNFNEHITCKLEVLATEYTNTQDRWRALGYQKAIGSIKTFPKRLETFEEISGLPFVGERLAKKIWEIVETGYLRRLDHSDPKMEAINLFTNVWGAGGRTAEIWVAQGYRTLADLEKCESLNFQQKIGLKYYHEFLERMPRSEVEEIEAVVRAKAMEISPDFELVTCGSYRRGRETCGDIDILLSHPDGRSHNGALPLILDKLKTEGFITDDLITTDKEQQKKYMGVFLLKGENKKHRRIDIIVTPYDQWPCALLHFTGSGHLNRSMRQLAKTKGMSLSEHGLRKNVVRKGQEKIFDGVPVPVFSEQDIFSYLGLDYLEPYDRDW